MARQLMRPRDAVAALVTPEGRRDPYPLYEEIRAHGPVVNVTDGLAVAVGYAEASRILREASLRVQDAAAYDAEYPGWRAHSSLRGYADSMLYRNPPDHERMRKLVSGLFTHRRVMALQPAIERMTERLLDGMADAGSAGSPVDFIAEFASRLPIAVISALLGVAEEDQAWFRAMAADITLALEGITNMAKLAPADAAMDELAEYFTSLIEARRRQPTDDILGDLAQVSAADAERLGHDELIGNLMLMLTAGFETTSFLLGHSLLLAFEHPVHATRLRRDPDFAANYVEEVLRFEPPVQATSRWAGADLDIMGTEIPSGSKVVVILAAANRDPARYDHPATFDPERVNIQPLSFAGGIHFCLGAPLSRLEARIALPRLLRRFPRLSPAGDPVRRDTWVGRGLDYFPVTLGA